MQKTKKVNVILFVVLAFVLTVPVIGTMAYLMDSDKKENTFVIGTVDTELVETFELSDDQSSMVKKNVYVQNNGNADVYVRAKILVYYEDAEGCVQSFLPKAGIDYSMNMGTDWFLRDGYYYYSDILKDNSQTSNLINTCNEISSKDNTYLVVDIITESIQALPISLVEGKWSVKVDTATGKLQNN